MTKRANRLACAHYRRKISALRAPKNRIEETVSPCCIIRRSWRSRAFFSLRDGRPLTPIGKQLVQFHNISAVRRRFGHIQAQANGSNRRARRNISSDVEREYAAACLTQRCLTGEEMKTKSIASVTNIRIVIHKECYPCSG